MTVAVDALPVPRRVDDDRTAFTRPVLALSKRSILAIYRQPALVAPSLIFPLFFAALGASSFDRATALPGFPQVDSFLSFSLAGSITQGVLFGSVTGGAALATDIEDGFFDRLLASPTSRVGILIGRLAGAAVFGAFQALFFSSAFFPRETMQGVYQTIANVNPVSHLVEGLRGLVIDGLTWGNVAKAVLVPVGIGVFSIALAMRTLAGRLAAR